MERIKITVAAGIAAALIVALAGALYATRPDPPVLEGPSGRDRILGVVKSLPRPAESFVQVNGPHRDDSRLLPDHLADLVAVSCLDACPRNGRWVTASYRARRGGPELCEHLRGERSTPLEEAQPPDGASCAFGGVVRGVTIRIAVFSASVSGSNVVMAGAL